VVSPAFGVYVGTALTFFFLGLDPGDPGAGQACAEGISRRPTLTRVPGSTTRQRRSLPVLIVAGQNTGDGHDEP